MPFERNMVRIRPVRPVMVEVEVLVKKNLPLEGNLILC